MALVGRPGVRVDAARLEVVARAELPSADGVAGRARRLLVGARPTHLEEVLAVRALPELLGTTAAGGVAQRVGVDVVGAPTSVGRSLALSTRVRVVVEAAGRTVVADRTVFVRRRPPADAGGLPPGLSLDGPAAVVLGPAGPAGRGTPVDGPTRRPLGLRVLLLAGPAAVAAGHLEVDLVRHTRRTPLASSRGAGLVLADDVVVHRRLATPALAAAGSAELPVDLEVPVLAAQTSTTTSGSVAWSVSARWRAPGLSVEGVADVLARVPSATDLPRRA